MEMGLILCAVVITVCIVTNKMTNRLGVPAVLVFMGIGMLFGSEGIVKIPFDDFSAAERICSTSLVFIMFYGGFGTNFKEAKKVLPQAVSMATLGVVLTAGITGLFCHLVLKTSIQEGLLIGAVVASTDAASVFSILRSKKLDLKDGTASLLEVESGSNDPFAYMITMAVLSWMSADGQNIWLMLAKQLGIGLAFGVGIGVLATWCLNHIEFEVDGIDTILMIALVLFGYAGSVMLGGNGYLSVYLFGIIIGNHEFEHKISMVHFFDGINHLAQILIFFLLGLLVFPSDLLHIAGKAVLVFAGLTFLARPLTSLIVLTPFKASWRQQLLIAFSGLRGAASIVFAILVTVSSVYTKDDVFNIVFCVALISVAFQGMLLPFAAKKLNMVDKDQNVMKTFSDYQEKQQIQLIQMTMNEGHKYIGRKISELKIKNMLIVLIERGDEDVVPEADVVIQEGDVLVLSAESYQGDIDAILKEEMIREGDGRIGKRIQELPKMEEGMIVLLRRTDGSTVIPKGETKIKVGDVLVTNGRKAAV